MQANHIWYGNKLILNLSLSGKKYEKVYVFSDSGKNYGNTKTSDTRRAFESMCENEFEKCLFEELSKKFEKV